MLKELIAKLFSNGIVAGVGKIILVSTVGITTATTGAYLFGENSNTLFDSNKVETEENDSILATDQQTQEEVADENDIETSSSKSSDSSEVSGINEFVVDIVTGASKLITGTVNGFNGSNQTTDVNTGSSKQTTSTTVGTNPLPTEDTSTGSSRTVSVGGTIVYVDDDDDENEYEEIEYEDESEDEDEDEDEHEDEHEDEDDEDED